jgi:hypothetical protein
MQRSFKEVVRNPLRFCEAKSHARRLNTIPVERLKSCRDETHSGPILFACVDNFYLLLHFVRICSECSGRSIWFSGLDCIRHPMYSALFLYSLGQLLVLPNWIAGPSYLVTFGILFAFRIRDAPIDAMRDELMMFTDLKRD